jgi:hypothetical protein
MIERRSITSNQLHKIFSILSISERIEKHHGVVNYKFDKKLFNWILNDLNISGKITGGNFFETPNPFHIHTDTGKKSELGELTPKYNIVIPLTEEADHNTVIFDQQWHGDASHFMIGSIYKYWPDPVYNLRKTNYDGVENLTVLPFNEDDYINYLAHLPYETVQGLSVKQVVPWKVGEALIFDSSLLHCGSYFKGIKKGLTILVSDV